MDSPGKLVQENIAPENKTTSDIQSAGIKRNEGHRPCSSK
jgi:hypothetical protein